MSDFGSLTRAKRMAAAAMSKNSTKRLLEDADLNIGNEHLIACSADLVIKIPTPNPPRILKLDAESKTAQVVTVGIGASVPIGVSSNFPGLITAILEFGNGGRFSRAEVDVPIGPFINPAAGASADPQTGGVLVSLPAGTLRVYGRNDANYVTPDVLNTIPAGALPPNDQDPAHPIAPVNMIAHATYFTARCVRNPTKTLFLGRAAAGGGGIIVGADYTIPAFASSFRIMRNPTATAATVAIRDANRNILDAVTVLAGSSSPTIPLPGAATFVTVGCNVAASDCLALSFDIGL